MNNTLVLFSYDWDATGFARLAANTGKRFSHAGFDLFAFPSNAHLAWFDLDRFVNRLCRRAKAEGWSAVTSQHEQFGALAAALMAEKMGWPGTAPAAVAACQHKLYARDVLQRVCPEANVAYTRLPCKYGEPIPEGLRYPVFVKPVKAAFSVLAALVNSREALHTHTRFGAFELWVIRHLVEPFERITQRLLPQAGTSHSLMLEEPVWRSDASVGQYSLDGIAYAGEIKPLGVVDSIMYPGTQSFMRFDYPSLLAHDIQARALVVAQKFLREIGFEHGIFNMEFFYDASNDRLSVIEFNPRMASQFADLYLRVDGRDLYAMALALAHGQDPWEVPCAAPSAGAATSLVYRTFDAHSTPTMPDAAQTAHLQAQFPDHFLLPYPKDRQSIERDFKWLGSYRYGILHMGGQDADDLRSRCVRASHILQWPTPYQLALHETVTHLQPSMLSTPSPLTPLRLST